MTLRPYYVYVLVDPRDCSTRYVGQTVNPLRRLESHRWRGAGAVRHWAKKLALQGLIPEMRIIGSYYSQSEVDKAETAAIARFRANGARLLNIYDEATSSPMPFGSRHSLETRAKMSAARVGNRNAHGNKGKPKSQAHREAISQALKGHACSPLVLAALHKGRAKARANQRRGIS